MGGRPEDATFARVDMYLRLGTAPAPVDLPQWATPHEYVSYVTQPDNPAGSRHRMGRHVDRLARWTEMGPRLVSFEDLLTGRDRGRTTDEQITYSERGNLQGNQFWAVAGRVYEAARAGWGARTHPVALEHAVIHDGQELAVGGAEPERRA